MVSDTYKISEQNKERLPAELYHFWSDNGQVNYRFTSHDSVIEYDSNNFLPIFIKRNNISYKPGEISTLNLEMEVNQEVIQPFILYNPIDYFWVEVFRVLKGMSPSLEKFSIFTGILGSVVLSSGIAKVDCVSLEYFLNSQVPRIRFHKSCQWILFDDRCGLDKADWKVSNVDLSDIDESVLTSSVFSGYNDNYFTMGWVEYSGHKRRIVKHEGNKITLFYPIPDLELDSSGATIDVYPGCDLSMRTCKNKFSNLSNFGGCPYIPFNNPATNTGGL